MAMSIKLTGKAARWLQMLEDFGHLAPDEVDRLLVGVAELHADASESTTSTPAVVDAPMIRRAAAIMLFGHAEEGKALEEDWPLLFT
jgi:hypothetical protein